MLLYCLITIFACSAVPTSPSLWMIGREEMITGTPRSPSGAAAPAPRFLLQVYSLVKQLTMNTETPLYLWRGRTKPWSSLWRVWLLLSGQESITEQRDNHLSLLLQ